ncbi:MAG: class I poly(R)-hydroxyalkanoic acid synthase [Alphaproteobacteria bacterium]|nr:class I poly(R)-hydroxyalkanoic acid synthase [Alphaproteobacteria bacterium]
MAQLALRAQKAMFGAMARGEGGDMFQIPDPVVVTQTMMESGMKLMADPAKLAEAQLDFLANQTRLMQNVTKRLRGEEADPVAAPPKGDKRFADEAWNEPGYDALRQSYLLGAEWLKKLVHETPGLDEQTRRKADFFTRLMVDAVSPSNFLATNPVAQKAMIESRGETLRKGMEHLVEDIERGGGRLSVRMVDETAFEMGRNIAASPGKVVYQNELMQLIQYSPSTPEVFERPLLIIPPWINKFYILDLRPKNSYIKWLVDQGLTVFVISWINPGPELAHKGFEDYMNDGPMAALDAIEKVVGDKKANVIGYCIGGTLTACMLAWMAAKGDDRVVSATYFTALTDFEEAGELKVFIDEDQLALLERHLETKGCLEGRHMAQVFNLLRDNDLIWSFVVNNYLLGKEPMPFDLLYWNADSTRMPAMMHRFYLRNFYLDNLLVKPGGITMGGVPLDLRKIETPTYMLSTREDHIAPWKATYSATQLYAGPVRFVLSGSGHIAGVINPPSSGKYPHWINESLPADPDAWLAGAQEVAGSWWTDWMAWITPHAGAKVPARDPAKGGLPVIEDAPGAYVKLRAEG